MTIILAIFINMTKSSKITYFVFSVRQGTFFLKKINLHRLVPDSLITFKPTKEQEICSQQHMGKYFPFFKFDPHGPCLP